MRRHSTRGTGALALWLLSASVLLALVWGGAVAHATDSSGIQYSDAPPTVTGDNPPKEPAAGGTPPARSSKTDGGAPAPRTGTADPQSSEGRSSAGGQSSSRGDKPTGDGDGGTAQSSPDAGSTDKRAVAQAGGQQLGAPVGDEDDGGSSPLLPILIAVLVLAAVSAAVVLARARRHDGGPVEPDAPRAS